MRESPPDAPTVTQTNFSGLLVLLGRLSRIPFHSVLSSPLLMRPSPPWVCHCSMMERAKRILASNSLARVMSDTSSPKP